MALARGNLAVAVELEHEPGGMAITLTAQRLARFVELSMEGADVIFSDNDFDLPAGRPRTVTCLLPSGWTLDRARAALQVRSEYDARV